METINIEEIKRDRRKRDQFIQEYIPFTIKHISKTLNRYVDIDNDDEFSIGLIAFNEAIERYKPDKGNFFSYAQLIIRSRLIDYMRKENKSQTEMVQYDEQVSKHDEKKEIQDQYILREEILTFKKALKIFKITLEDLVECSPKQKATVERCMEVAHLIHSNLLLRESLYKKRKLPSTSLHKKYGFSTKFLKSYRKFIIAEVMILDNSLDLLRDWTPGEGREQHVL